MNKLLCGSTIEMVLKVIKNKNGFLKTSFLPKNQRNYFKVYCPGYIIGQKSLK